MRPEHRPLRSILIHSYMNLRFTTKAIGPREEEVSGGKQSFLSTTVKTVTLGRARCICICRRLCLEALGGGTVPGGKE